MSNILRFNFEYIDGNRKSFSLVPYRVTSDYDYYTDYLFDVPYQAYPFFQQIDSIANRINLYDILYDDFIQLYHRGVDYDTPVGDEITLFTTEVTPNGGTPITGSAYYTLSYRIANPYSLTFNITSGEIIDENQATNIHAITIDFTPSHKLVEREKYYIIALEKKVINSLYIEYNGKDYTDFNSLNIGCFAMCYAPAIVDRYEVDPVSGETYLADQTQAYHLFDVDGLPRLPSYTEWNALTPFGAGDRQWLYACGKYGYSSTSESGWPTSYAVQPWYTLCCADAVIKINDEVYEFTDPEDPDGGQNDNTESHSYNARYSEQSDSIPNDGVPLTDALQSGFIHAYLMTPTNSKALANYLLSDNFVDNAKKLMANPIDYILSYIMLPVIPTIGQATAVLIGGVNTEVLGRPIQKEFLMVDCGSVKCNEFWGGFPDYSPATKISIYVPFVGVQPLDIDDCMSGELTLTYRVDVLTGEFVASLHNRTERGLDSELYHWAGCMSMDISISQTNYNQKIQNVITGASGICSFAMSGGADIGGLLNGGTSLLAGTMTKPNIQKSGNITGSAGILDNYTPFLIIDRPAQALPKYYGKLRGYPSQIGGKLSSFSGYTEIESIDLSGINATDEEKEEILNDLKGGVFI